MGSVECVGRDEVCVWLCLCLFSVHMTYSALQMWPTPMTPSPQTRKLLGTDDLTFIEMLMGVPANGEVAEIIAANFDSSPESAGFAAEFIRRKTEYIARGGAEGKRRKRR